MPTLAEAVGGSSWTMSDAEEPSPHSSAAQTMGLECTTVTTVLMQGLHAVVIERLLINKLSILNSAYIL